MMWEHYYVNILLQETAFARGRIDNTNSTEARSQAKVYKGAQFQLSRPQLDPTRSMLFLLTTLAVLTAAHAQAAKPAGFPARRSSSPRAYYTANWAVEITAGGAKMANLIAKKNGFTNLGEVYNYRISNRTLTAQ